MFRLGSTPSRGRVRAATSSLWGAQSAHLARALSTDARARGRRGGVSRRPGLGFAVAKRFAAGGMKVGIVGRQRDRLDACRREILAAVPGADVECVAGGRGTPRRSSGRVRAAARGARRAVGARVQPLGAAVPAGDGRGLRARAARSDSARVRSVAMLPRAARDRPMRAAGARPVPLHGRLGVAARLEALRIVRGSPRRGCARRAVALRRPRARRRRARRARRPTHSTCPSSSSSCPTRPRAACSTPRPPPTRCSPPPQTGRCFTPKTCARWRRMDIDRRRRPLLWRCFRRSRVHAGLIWVSKAKDLHAFLDAGRRATARDAARRSPPPGDTRPSSRRSSGLPCASLAGAFGARALRRA